MVDGEKMPESSYKIKLDYQLIKDEWELYDDKRLRKHALLIIGLVMLLWLLIFFLLSVFSIPLYFVASEFTLAFDVAIASVVTLAFMVYVFRMVRRTTRDRHNWYFSGLMDDKLNVELAHEWVRDILTTKGIAFDEESHPIELNLKITYFHLTGTDIHIRLWYSLKIPNNFLEIGVGPLNSTNWQRVKELRTVLAHGVKERFIPGAPEIEGN